MLIRPIIDKLNTSSVFNTVKFSRDIPELDKFDASELPAVYMLPANARGGADDGDLSTQQEITFIYSFCVITTAPSAAGSDEPLAEALDELRRLLFGFQMSEQYAPITFGDGDLYDFNTKSNAWIDSYITRKTYRA